MIGEMFQIRVPASTANLGPGFDSIGLALGLYLTIEGSYADHWEVIPLTSELSVFPTDDSNYIVAVAKKIAKEYNKELHPCLLKVSSDIPLTRGLGSSASAIVAGIELANVVGGLYLSQKEKNRHASLLEGHPDNAAASVCGGLVVGLHSLTETDVLSFPLKGIKVVVVIPNYELRTEDSRNVLPDQVPFKEAIDGSAASNVLVSALLTENWALAGSMMSKDRFHQPYRAQLVPHLQRIEEIALGAGAFGTALSGAGPTVLCLVTEDLAQNVQTKLQQVYPEYEVKILNIDNNGSMTTKLSEQAL